MIRVSLLLVLMGRYYVILRVCLQRQLEEGKYDSDLSRVLEQLAQHRHGYEEVQSFRSRIDKCISDRVSLAIFVKSLRSSTMLFCIIYIETLLP